MTTTEIISLIVSTLVGTGALGFFIKYGIRLAVLERLFADKAVMLNQVKVSQEGMDKRLTMVESAIIEIRNIVPELAKVASIGAKLDNVVEKISEMVTRREMDARLDAVEAQIKN